MFYVWLNIHLMVIYPKICIKLGAWTELTYKNLLLCKCCNAKLSKYLQYASGCKSYKHFQQKRPSNSVFMVWPTNDIAIMIATKDCSFEH